MGTPDFSVAALDALIKSGYAVVAVYTQPPKPAGRGYQLQKSAVHSRADALGIPVFTPKSLKKDIAAQEEFAKLALDIAIVAAYGLILPKAVLDAPRYGCLNIHASLLPRWRGAAPIQRAILEGDRETGICIMQMEEGLDTGPVLKLDSLPITTTTTTASLQGALAQMGARLIVDVVEKIARGNPYPPQQQTSDGMTYAKMLTRDDGRVDWTKSASDIERQLRALIPWPGVWFMHGKARIKLLAAEVTQGKGKPGEILDKSLTVACGQDALKITLLQPADRKAMDGTSFINGKLAAIGDILT